MFFLINFLFFLSKSRKPRTLFVDPRLDGDCFSKSCSIKDAARVVRPADTLHFPDDFVLKPTTFPSEFSDFFVQVSLNNATVYAHGTVIDGLLFSGEHLADLMSHPEYCWCLMINWTFRHFSSPLFTRSQIWSQSPSYVFRDCIFEDCQSALFKISGGTFIFENCIFKNIDDYVFKAQTETHVEFVDCKFENTKSVFLLNSDATFINCIFRRTKGNRGGSIYSQKSTLHVEHCFFIDTYAMNHGGAIYIRDSPLEYESEIKDSCFYETKCGQNGTSIYSFSSQIKLSDNCFTSNDPIFSYLSTIDENNRELDSKCEKCFQTEPANVIQDDYTPVDTYKLTELDDLSGDTTIIIEDSEDDIIL